MVELLGISKPIIIDWYNHCRQVCKNDNITHHDSHKLGARIETLDTGETPTIIVQIDECLLRGKRLYNRGRMLQGDENIPIADRGEWRRMNNDDTMPQNRNYGMRISGLWIFGLVECIRDNQGQYKSRRSDFLRWKEEIRRLSFHLSEVMSIPVR
ncbi:hypothetical protein RF11_03413 [Thelohanellus kitauei]|uniref:Uncharacterized protein n=1 Tax=Thelohanellus kitauei TaxID=669202 RepID=A0A0C2JXW1_THEKT|nr:hypothetical protein RF11_03413 [Thelohanellus kitauei]